jgi:predicted kinase
MDAIVLCGVQGSGKTTLYRDRFLATHVRVSMDLLRTRAREAAFLALCLQTRQPFVVDNTNPTPADRRRYVEPARAAGFRAIGYLVEVDPAVALARNAGRSGRERVPDRGVAGTAKRLIRPSPEEGFDELWHATAAPDGWRIEPLIPPGRCSEDSEQARLRQRERLVDRRERVGAELQSAAAAFSSTCSGRDAPTIAAATLGSAAPRRARAATACGRPARRRRRSAARARASRAA